MADRAFIPKNLMGLIIGAITLFFVLLIIVVQQTEDVSEAPKEQEKIEALVENEMSQNEFRKLVESAESEPEKTDTQASVAQEPTSPPPAEEPVDQNIFEDLPPEPPMPSTPDAPESAPEPSAPSTVVFNPGYGVPGGADAAPEIFESYPSEKKPLISPPPPKQPVNEPDKAGHYEPDPSDALLVQQSPSPLMLREGAVIRCVLMGDINTQLPGPIRLRVVSDVYDSLGHRTVLIPKGAVLSGTVDDKPLSVGLDRVPVAVDRILLPDGRSVPLKGMQMSDAMGTTGVPAEFHSNLLRAIGPGALVAWLGYRIDKELNPSLQSATAQSNGSSVSTISEEIFPILEKRIYDRYGAAKPYYTVESGALVTLMLADDIAFPTSD